MFYEERKSVAKSTRVRSRSLKKTDFFGRWIAAANWHG